MSFDAVAPHYRWMERILAGSKLHRCRTAFKEHLPPAGRVLILGEGHGRFLEFLSRVNWTGEVTCVDSSKEMLKQAQRRIGNSSKNIHVTWLHADALSWKPHPHG